MGITHLHPVMEESHGKYRRCDRAILLAQISSNTIRRLNGTGEHRRVVEAERTEDLYMYTIGVLIPLGEKLGIRVLYTWLDLYLVELVRWTDTDFEVLESVDMVDAEMVSEVVLSVSETLAT